MPAKGPVSLNRQTIYVIIPILDLYAAYQIMKLRWFLLWVWGSGFLISTLISWVLPFPYSYAVVPIEIAIAIYLIRRWSKKWNDQFTN